MGTALKSSQSNHGDIIISRSLQGHVMSAIMVDIWTRCPDSSEEQKVILLGWASEGF